MMPSPKKCFWVTKISGEAVAPMMSFLSGASEAIDEVILVSDYFGDDISGTISMTSAIEAIKKDVPVTTELSKINPLYTPASAKEIESAFVESDEDGNSMKFTLMDGNPFTIRMTKLMLGEEAVVEAKLACMPFELPTYNEIIQAHSSLKLN